MSGAVLHITVNKQVVTTPPCVETELLFLMGMSKISTCVYCQYCLYCGTERNAAFRKVNDNQITIIIMTNQNHEEEVEEEEWGERDEK